MVDLNTSHIEIEVPCIPHIDHFSRSFKGSYEDTSRKSRLMAHKVEKYRQITRQWITQSGATRSKAES